MLFISNMNKAPCIVNYSMYILYIIGLQGSSLPWTKIEMFFFFFFYKNRMFFPDVVTWSWVIDRDVHLHSSATSNMIDPKRGLRHPVYLLSSFYHDLIQVQFLFIHQSVTVFISFEYHPRKFSRFNFIPLTQIINQCGLRILQFQCLRLQQ